MTNEDVFELLKQQEEALLQKPVFYVHYDSLTNNVVSLRNYLDTTDALPFFEIKEEDIGVPLERFDITSYKVTIKDGKNKLEKIIINEELLITTIDDFIYEIPKVVSAHRITADERPFDLQVEQNNLLRIFRIKLSKSLKEKFSLQSRDSQVVCLYVTAVNDPNILYKTLKVSMSELIYNEFYTIEFDDFQGDDVNIYGLKYFTDYLHVDIR